MHAKSLSVLATTMWNYESVIESRSLL